MNIMNLGSMEYRLELPASSGESPITETGISDAMGKYNELGDLYGKENVKVFEEGKEIPGYDMKGKYRFYMLHVVRFR